MHNAVERGCAGTTIFCQIVLCFHITKNKRKRDLKSPWIRSAAERSSGVVGGGGGATSVDEKREEKEEKRPPLDRPAGVDSLPSSKRKGEGKKERGKGKKSTRLAASGKPARALKREKGRKRKRGRRRRGPARPDGLGLGPAFRVILLKKGGKGEIERKRGESPWPPTCISRAAALLPRD